MKKTTKRHHNHDDGAIINAEDFGHFILENDHPCVMAKTVFTSKKFNVRSYPELGSVDSAKRILKDIEKFLQEIEKRNSGYFSFIAVFESEVSLEEIEFERLLWQQLQHVHDLDDSPWDPNVSHNPQDNTFSFSILGHSFYIVGMHPNSARISRRSPKPTLVFNLHSQFERLKKKKVYDRVKSIIRQRDKKRQGSVNPMMFDFGVKSEARQYSGRKVGDDWTCPFKHKHAND